MKTYSYKKAEGLLKAGLLLIILGLFASPSYAFFESCEDKYGYNVAEALSRGDIDCAEEITMKIGDGEGRLFLDRRDPYGRTPLMIAVQHNLEDMVHLLIQKNADPFAKSRNGFTAKDFAYAKSKEERIEERIYNHREHISILSAGEQRERLEEQVRLWQAELERELEDGPDFYDTLSEDIYYTIVSYEASYGL